MLFVKLEKAFLFHLSWTDFRSPQGIVGRSLDNADFNSPKVQKPIADTSEYLARISVKGMVLNPVFCSLFLGKYNCGLRCGSQRSAKTRACPEARSRPGPRARPDLQTRDNFPSGQANEKWIFQQIGPAKENWVFQRLGQATKKGRRIILRVSPGDKTKTKFSNQRIKE